MNLRYFHMCYAMKFLSALYTLYSIVWTYYDIRLWKSATGPKLNECQDADNLLDQLIILSTDDC